MATISRAFESELEVGGDGPTTVVYNIRGTDDELTALTLLQNEATANPIWNNRFAGGLKIVRSAWNEWVGNIIYRVGSPETKPTEEGGGRSIQFEISTETTHITQSLSTRNRYPATPYTHAPDHKGAINVSKDGVEGADILTPVMSWTETHFIPAANIDPDTYLATLKSLVGRTFNASFRGFDAGEVLFVGVAGGLRDDKPIWQMDYRFAQSDNVNDLEIGDITVSEKKGWDYLWIEYASDEDTDAKRIVRKPVAAHVEVVYYEGDPGSLILSY